LLIMQCACAIQTSGAATNPEFVFSSTEPYTTVQEYVQRIRETT